MTHYISRRVAKEIYPEDIHEHTHHRRVAAEFIDNAIVPLFSEVDSLRDKVKAMGTIIFNQSGDIMSLREEVARLEKMLAATEERRCINFLRAERLDSELALMVQKVAALEALMQTDTPRTAGPLPPGGSEPIPGPRSPVEPGSP